MKPVAMTVLMSCVALGSAYIAFSQVEVPPTQAFSNRENPWQIPVYAGSGEAVNEAYARLAQDVPWRAAKAVTETVVEETARNEMPSWHFIGTVAQSDTRFALVEVDGKVGRYRVGDSLPDDGLLVSIGVDQIGVEREAEIELRRIFEGAARPKAAPKAASTRPRPETKQGNYWGNYDAAAEANFVPRRK